MGAFQASDKTEFPLEGLIKYSSFFLSRPVQGWMDGSSPLSLLFPRAGEVVKDARSSL